MTEFSKPTKLFLRRAALGAHLLFAYTADAQTPKSSVPSPLAASGTAEAVRVERAPKLDGTLDDPLWQSAQPVTDFRQREPHESEAPSEKTEVRILYTRHAVYFGIYCHDSAPNRIVATELRRV